MQLIILKMNHVGTRTGTITITIQIKSLLAFSEKYGQIFVIKFIETFSVEDDVTTTSIKLKCSKFQPIVKRTLTKNTEGDRSYISTAITSISVKCRAFLGLIMSAWSTCCFLTTNFRFTATDKVIVQMTISNFVSFKQ